MRVAFSSSLAVAVAIAFVHAAPARAAGLTVQVQDASGAPLADAAVAVYVKGTRATAPADTGYELAQQGRQFRPQVNVVQTGTAVRFPNFDTVRHHVYSFSPIQKFELKLYAGTPAAPVVFDKPGVAVLGCNIHDKMRGWVVVVDTPFFAKTDAAGHATLDVPAGEHVLRAWHALLPDGQPWPEQPLSIGATAPARVEIRIPAAGA